MQEQPRSVTLAQIKMRDDMLSEDFKQRFPVLSMSEIRTRFPNHFVAFLETHVGDGLIVEEARLIFACTDRADFARQCQQAHSELPDHWLQRRFIPPADLRDLDLSVLYGR